MRAPALEGKGHLTSKRTESILADLARVVALIFAPEGRGRVGGVVSLTRRRYKRWVLVRLRNL